MELLPHEEEKPVLILIEDDSIFERDESFTPLVFFDQPPVEAASSPTEPPAGTEGDSSTQVGILNDDGEL